jgi:hypothetical protein
VICFRERHKSSGVEEFRMSANILGCDQVDPLGDETIPQYKIWKETSNACVQWTQWISLMVVCILLICSVRLQSLRKVYWYNLVLWEWLTLALVVACGRLISGFAVKVNSLPSNQVLDRTLQLCVAC